MPGLHGFEEFDESIALEAGRLKSVKHAKADDLQSHG